MKTDHFELARIDVYSRRCLKRRGEIKSLPRFFLGFTTHLMPYYLVYTLFLLLNPMASALLERLTICPLLARRPDRISK
jgi:hypothetical protein